MVYNPPPLLVRKIDDELRKRRGRKRPYVDISAPKGRHIGTLGDLTDIAFDVPWQKTVLDQTGCALPINEEYHCLKCGYRYNGSFPPQVCIKCGFKSPLFDKDAAKKAFGTEIKWRE